jgi:uncharacterized protein (TIGR02646 family)
LRYINNRALSLPIGWSDRARVALEMAESATGLEERAKAINARSSVWTELKESLAALSHNKCWYCETEQERSDNAVDHFRPKGRVAECTGHEGYWWLAFDWKNYRFSCTYCNSRRKDRKHKSVGGKQDHFPLIDEHNRVLQPGGDIDAEEPCLLDPTVATDPSLLWFNDEGRVVPKCPSDEHLNLRAEASIRLYNLNYCATEEKRRNLYREIERLVVEGNRCFEKSKLAATPVEWSLARGTLTRVTEYLMDAISPQTQFSAAAKAYLMGFRDDEHEWIDDVLRTH